MIMTEYINTREAYKLKQGEICICKCPEWSIVGLQVVEWNGKEFEYEGQPNDMFNEMVTEFLPIDQDGDIFPNFYNGYFKNEYRNE